MTFIGYPVIASSSLRIGSGTALVAVQWPCPTVLKPYCVVARPFWGPRGTAKGPDPIFSRPHKLLMDTPLGPSLQNSFNCVCKKKLVHRHKKPLRGAKRREEADPGQRKARCLGTPGLNGAPSSMGIRIGADPFLQK